MKDFGLPIKDIPLCDYQDILQTLINNKPTERIQSYEQPMHEIGG